MQWDWDRLARFALVAVLLLFLWWLAYAGFMAVLEWAAS